MVEEEIVIGGTYRHPEGIEYRVEKVVDDVTGWEATHQIRGRTVYYTQLEAGMFPAGKEWSRDEADFLRVFEYLSK